MPSRNAKWLGHSPKVAAQHYLMSRDHHFEDVVAGGEASPSGGVEVVQGSRSECDAKCASIATRSATQQASARDSTEPHTTTETAATIQVAAGSTFFFMPCQRQGIRAPKEPGIRMAGTGFERTAFSSGSKRIGRPCSANCRAVEEQPLTVIARAALLVAQMDLPNADREAVLSQPPAARPPRLSPQRQSSGRQPSASRPRPRSPSSCVACSAAGSPSS